MDALTVAASRACRCHTDRVLTIDPVHRDREVAFLGLESLQCGIDLGRGALVMTLASSSNVGTRSDDGVPGILSIHARP